MTRESQDIIESRRLGNVSNEIGMNYARKGRLEDAMQCFNEAVAWDDMDPSYHANLSWAHEQFGQNDSAVEQLREAVDVSRGNPSDIAYYSNNLGALYYRMGLYEASLKAFTIALDLVPGYEGFLANMKAAKEKVEAGSEKAITEGLKPFEQPLQAA